MRMDTESAEFVTDLPGGRPEVAICRGDGASWVGADDCAYGVTALLAQGGGTEPALQARRGRADSGADCAKSKILTRRGESARTQVAIRIGVPVLVPAVGQVEQDGSGDDRDRQVGVDEATAHRAEAIAHTGRSVETISRATRKHEGVNAIHQSFRRQQDGLPG